LIGIWQALIGICLQQDTCCWVLKTKIKVVVLQQLSSWTPFSSTKTKLSHRL
jgi:hypothetical protein